MNAGQLKYRAELFALEGSPLSVVSKNKYWCGLTFAKSAGEQLELRSSTQTTMLFRKNSALVVGRFVVVLGRLFVIDAVSNDQVESNVVASELIGESATYTPVGGTARTIPVFLKSSAPYANDDGSTTYRYRLDVSKYHVPGSIGIGDTFALRGQTWTVVGVPDGSDDGAVVKLLVRR